MSQPRPGHTVALLHSGAEYFPALLAAIAAAQTEVLLDTYIFMLDDTGVQVAQALEAAALRGVAVHVVADAIGTPMLEPAWTTRWNTAGVLWHRYAPLGHWGLLFPKHWRRLHRKLCVVDAAVLLCGGINVLDDLNDPVHGLQAAPRFDFAVQVTGPLVADAHRTMRQLRQRLLARQQLRSGHLVAASRALRKPPTPKAKSTSDAALPLPTGPGVAAALVLRDNLRHRRSIERMYRQAIAQARHEVLIANAYFLPGAKLHRALVLAARRGVRVRLLLQGKYEYFMQYHTAKVFYRALLQTGVEIYEYHAGYLHAKVAVIDGHWATVGSSNLDPLSLLLAREANVVVHDSAFATALHRALHQAMQTASVRMEPEALARRPWLQKAKDKLAYGLMRFLLFASGRDY